MYNKLRTSLLEIIETWENADGVRDEDVNDFPEFRLKQVLTDCSSFKLYRYSPPTYYNIRNIETQKIHLSENGIMNDVFEGLPDFLGYKTYAQVKELHDLAYMTCFSESNKSVLMWSHYAKNHEGICVEYDFKRLYSTLDKYDVLGHLFPVVYRNKRTQYRDLESLTKSLSMLRDAIRENIVYDGEEELTDLLPLLLIKSTDWDYEKEWRILYTKKQMYDINDDELYRMNIPLKCVSAIYLGYRIDPEVKQNLIEISSRLSTVNGFVPVFQAKLSPSGYGIEFAQLN